MELRLLTISVPELKPPKSGSFHQQAKKLINTLIFAIYLVILSLKTDVNVPTESNKQNKLEKSLKSG